MKILNSEYGMDCLMRLNENQRIVFIRVLVRLATVDGQLDANEKDFIKELAKIYNISKERIAEVFAFSSDEEIVNSVKIIEDRPVALALIREMCVLAHADNNLSSTEMLLIGRIGQAMNIELEKIEQISQWVIAKEVLEAERRLIFEEVV